jgi:hypothetical protein
LPPAAPATPGAAGGTILPDEGGDLPPATPAFPSDPRQAAPAPAPAIAVVPVRAVVALGRVQPSGVVIEAPSAEAAPLDLLPILPAEPAAAEAPAPGDAVPVPDLAAPPPGPIVAPGPSAPDRVPADPDEAAPAAAPPLPSEVQEGAEPAVSLAPLPIAVVALAPPVPVATAEAPGPAPAVLLPAPCPLRQPAVSPVGSADGALPVRAVLPAGPLREGEPDAPAPREPQAAVPSIAAVQPAGEAPPTAAPPVPAGPAPAITASASPVPERAEPRTAPQQETAIAQVGELREALRAGRPGMMLNHAEFGLVSLRIEAAASPDQWRAVLASRDPGFVPAVQAALAERAVAAAAAADGGGSLLGQNGGQGGGQNGTGDHRYGASPNGGQGGSQPYPGQSGSRDGEAAPDHRRPSTAAALAARGEEEDPGSPASGMNGMFA